LKKKPKGLGGLTPEQLACFDTKFMVEPRKIETERLTPEMRANASSLRKKGAQVAYYEDAWSGVAVGLAVLPGRSEADMLREAQEWIYWYVLLDHGDFDSFDALIRARANRMFEKLKREHGDVNGVG
jgi:hypothetical protein